MWVTAGMSERGTLSLSIPHNSLLAAVSGTRRSPAPARRAACTGESRVELEVIGGALPQHARRERTERPRGT